MAATLLNAPAAFAAPPAAPAVSVNAGLKQLQAQRSELWFRPNTGAAWARYAELPRWRTSIAINISAHLLHWNNARYAVKACNASGCGSSAPLGVSHLMQQTVGYFKPPAQVARQMMGWATALSEDGATLAAGIETDQSGGVEVFRKSPAGWAYETRLLADPKEQQPIAHVDPAVAVSGNGNVIAFGVDVQVRPGELAEEQPSTGAVYLFRRTATGWAREPKLTFADSMPEDRFGWRVDLDESGTLLAAWRKFGSPTFQAPGPWAHEGMVELFRNSGSAWVHLTTIPAVNASCYALGLSGGRHAGAQLRHGRGRDRGGIHGARSAAGSHATQ